MTPDILSLSAAPLDVRHAYGTAPSQFGELRLPRHRQPAPWPVVCVIHGGYYRARYDLTYIGHLAAALTREGLATWSIEYRRLSETGGGWPGTFLDVGAALDALRKLARSQPLDLTRVVTLGHSAGGQLALWLASRPRLPASTALSMPDPVSVRGVAAVAPVADLARASELGLSDGVVDQLMGGPPEAVAQRYALASPIQRLPLGVPQVVLHGTADAHVPIELSERYLAAARAVGDPVELVTLAGVDHFEPIDPRASAYAATREAVRRALTRSSPEGTLR
jgi:acetyl esterase/lipase